MRSVDNIQYATGRTLYTYTGPRGVGIGQQDQSLLIALHDGCRDLCADMQLAQQEQ